MLHDEIKTREPDYSRSLKCLANFSEAAPPILQRLDISTEHWIELSTKFEQRFKGIAGSAHSIKTLCAHFGLSRTINRSNNTLLYSHNPTQCL